jgi:magnesium transporter
MAEVDIGQWGNAGITLWITCVCNARVTADATWLFAVRALVTGQQSAGAIAMLSAWIEQEGRLVALPADLTLSEALWIDLFQPSDSEVAEVARLVPEVPTMEDMEEIEISSRLYREDGVDFMTVVLPGTKDPQGRTTAPVALLLGATRLVTVRHHAPRPFETYPTRADKVGPGCQRPDQVFLGLIEEVVDRLADHLEGVGRAMDEVSRVVLDRSRRGRREAQLEEALARVGKEGEHLGQLRVSLVTVERALSFFELSRTARPEPAAVKAEVRALTRDLQSLEVHADFLGARVALVSDTTLGMINLQQNATVRIVSVVAVLFLPPTLIASIYGMNFARMPELEAGWGYPAALGLMLLSAVGTWAYFKWRGWL